MSNVADFEIKRAFEDPDPTEFFYAVCWTYDVENGRNFIIAGGKRGIIRVICMDTSTVINNLIGHGDAVNEIRLCPDNSDIIASASKGLICKPEMGGEGIHNKDTGSVHASMG